MSGPPPGAAAIALWVAHLWQSAYESGRANERERIGDAVPGGRA